MSLIVQKFGGTSVATVECIKNAARRVAYERKRGHQVVVVVSAMAGVTDQLIKYCQEATPMPSPEEYDVVVSSGEQATCGLLALACQNFGVPARSYLGWQVPIETDSNHAKARISLIPEETLQKCLDQGVVPIVAGFQGISAEKRVTTFGRGGSDITAVAIAAAMEADRCDLYKDVSGIYTADPRIVPTARKLDKVSYEEMLELASLGSKVLQNRAIELAMAYKIPLRIFSSFEESTGTAIVDEEEIVEKALVHGIVCNRNEAKITLMDVPSRPGIASEVFGPLSQANITVDMIIHHGSVNCDVEPLTFTLNRSDMPQALEIISTLKKKIGFGEIVTQERVAKISVVGVGLRSHALLTGLLFKTLADRNIDILGITTSEIKVSVLIDEDFAELAVRALHTAYDLDQNEPQLKPALYVVGK